MSEPINGGIAPGVGVPHRLQTIQNINLTSLSGSQQFVLTSPVSLQQVQVSNSNADVLRLMSQAPRGGVAGDNPSMSFVAAAHPTLVTSLASRPLTNHVGHSRKRKALTELEPPVDPVKRLIFDDKFNRLQRKRIKHVTTVVEKSLLSDLGCLLELSVFRSRRNKQRLQTILKSYLLDPSNPDDDLTPLLTASTDSDGNDEDHGQTIVASHNDCTAPLAVIDVKPTFDKINRTAVELSPYKSMPSVASRVQSSSSLYDLSNIGSQDMIAERVKQEAYVAQRISELQREGLWAEKRLPKVQEPPRTKAHWDYLLEEMTWMCSDFNQERKWKKANAKKCARMVQKYFLDKETLQKKEEKSQELKLRRLAHFMAKEVKNFWANVNKLVEYKQTTRLEEKRKKALDQHLSFIVDQTEKYSTWLAESMNKTGQTSASNSCPPSDDDFQPNLSSSDDEETIAKEEDREADEVERLKNESELPLEDLLDQLPKDYFLNRDKDLNLVDSGSPKSDDMVVDDVSESPAKKDEHTKEEPMNDVRSKHAAGRESDYDESSSESEESAQSETESELEHSAEEDVSLKTLVDNKINMDGESGREEADKEINDVTAIAESLQPKGSTLQTASVATTVPFLLKHSLREYQHIGLDWLVTMFDRKLNGILADEMGLGKTIQTIALLTHLACDKGNWGPHLIIVPTSVMLNWEMEFKKWCPAFKILTYYGNIKERKAKRAGWTKANAFHICITSYKLVIQDHQSFRRKKWQYLVLDEAQNIKNFRSQRWQLLLNFQTARRLLLTGTPLQNNLMELWSLMHFLMPHVFQSHREFKEWFSNPVTGMLEGNSEYNESIIKRLHKVLRPFLLRRLKTEVEKQLPKKYEHVVMCRLSKRQRFLYDDFMSRAKTKETLAAGNLLSVINVLMQLRKVCNHPNLFEVRPIISPFQMEAIEYRTSSLAANVLDYDLEKHVSLDFLNLRLVDHESMTALGAFLTWRLHVARKLIEDLDALVTAEKPRPPKCALQLEIENCFRRGPVPISSAPITKNAARLATLPAVEVGRSPCLKIQDSSVTPIKVSGSEVHLIPGMMQTAQLVQTASGRHIFFPLPSASNSVNSVIANGQRLSLGNLKSHPPQQVVQGPEPDVDVMDTAVTKTLAVAVKRLSAIVTRSDPDEVTSPLHQTQSAVEERRRARRLARLCSLAAVHERRCERYPLYGADTVDRFRIVDAPQQQPSTVDPAAWRWSGSAACHVLATPRRSRCRRPHHTLWSVTDALAEAVRTPHKVLQSMQDIISKFVVYVPAVVAPRLSMHVSHPPPSRLWRERRFEADLVRELGPRCRLLHPILRNMSTQFPDPRLIQYDCGKLQVLDRLLRQLKNNHHKVLLFTQMTRMLDVLEAFLNYHGYIYLRLDGTTKVDQRQVLMERFNGDDRIFVFILSTRSGGIGVNLTGADTVIFYDSDWNPTMDAQAQDRCHRIGQTRDVHIYRLVSEMTVEENILKKANQKRLLGDLAIEGGNFTTAYFKSQSTIQDLFTVDMNETDANKRMRQSLGSERERRGTDEDNNAGLEKAALGALESALATAEDAPDVEAARTATAEAAAELAEFDENIPLEEGPEAPPEAEVSRAELELQQLVQQLKPVERYAMRYVEENEAAWSAEQLAAAEAQIEEQKREWELNRQAAIEAEEARLRDEDEEQDVTTYPRLGSTEVWLNTRSMEGLPMWCPPTPPQELDDVYIDKNLRMLYERTLSETELPPVYVRKELKRSRTAEMASNLDMRRNIKMSRREDAPISAPRSLFDHPSSALQKMRRDVKMHKYRSFARPMSGVSSGATAAATGPLPTRILTTSTMDDNAPDWTIHEDYALLQAIEQIQDLPLSLTVVKAGHTPNWDLVSDMVNMVSCTIRSPAQCRNRFELVILPREEGKVILDPKKQKKTKSLYKSPPTPKSNRALRTCQLNGQDNNLSFTKAYHQRFDSIKSLVLSRKPNPKPLLVNPSLKNPKHLAVLNESGISYDNPLNPIEIAMRRADRIAKEKKLQAIAIQSSGTQAAQNTTTDQLTPQQRQIVVTAAANRVAQVANTVNAAVSLANSVVGSGQALSAVNVTTGQVHTQNIVTTIHTAGVTTLSPALRPARPVATIPVSLQDVVAASQARSTTNATATVVPVANLTPAQLQAARLASGSLVSIPASSVKAAGGTVQMAAGQKTLSPAQMNFYRQQTLMRAQNQRIGVRDQGQVKVVPGQTKVTQVATVQPGTTAQPRPQYMKQAAVAKGRQEEVAAMVMKQQLQRQKNQNQQSALTTQIFTQAGLQVQGASQQVATLVKTTGQNVAIPIPGIAVPQGKGTLTSQLKTTVGGTQQMRLGLPANYQQLLSKQARPTKVTQLTKPSISTMPTQLIVQSQGNKTVPTINMQHIQQVIKNSHPQHITVASQGVTGAGQVVLTKAAAGGTTTIGPRVLPAVGGARSIQVVPGSIRGVPNVSVNTSLSSALAGSLKMGTTQSAFISQVTGLPGIVRQSSVNPVRIQPSGSGTPIMAVTVQPQQNQQSSDHSQS